ncbi:MAG: outer membrane beta-barrel protein [Alphaproteobacteria bacterium]|nr:outer membrane beta-barrel protein [Alphaproteobacteria bacterium]
MTGMKVAALAGAATSIFAFFDLADAQEGEAEIRRIEPDAAIVTDGRQTYPADFFIGFSPVTALDMITRLPGYSLDGGDTGRRGLGDSFGNLLINGRRPSNKSISLDTVLQRIPAGDVERIELISDSAGEFEMRGHPRLANVILREGAGESTSWDLRLRYWDAGRVTPSGSISMSRRLGEVTELTLGLEGSLSARRFNRREALYDGAGNWLERRSESDQRESWEINPTFSLNTTLGDGSELRFDSRGWIWEWRRQNVGFVDGTQPGGGFAPIRFERSETLNYGLGGRGSVTWSRDWSDTLSSTSTGFISYEQFEDGPEPFEVYDPVAFVEAVIYEAEGNDTELALRQAFTWTPNEAHTIEFGAEGAFNARDSFVALTYDDGTTLTAIDLPVANARVEERRAELFGRHVWTLNDDVNIESGLRLEFSEISQTGDVEQSRTFFYPKPSVTLNWRLDDANRLRFAVQRDVAQLEFGKFASSVDLDNNNSTFGNPDYEPQRTWTVEAEWTRTFGDDASVSIKVGRDFIEGLDDFEPRLNLVTGRYFDVPGNIGDGTIDRVTLNATTPLDRIGLSNAVLTTFLEWYGTNITDPLTGRDRVFTGIREWEARLDFRQTFPEQQWAWGWDYYWLSNGKVFRANELQQQGFSDGDFDIYIETTRWFGVTTRLGADYVFDNGQDLRRYIFDPDQGGRQGGVVDFIEDRNTSEGATLYVQMRGTF